MTERTRPTLDPDDALVAELRRIGSIVDPVPLTLVDAARASLTWRSVDAELAELLADSALVDDERLALVRSEGGPRTLSFEASDLVIELEVLPEGARRRLVGQLVPPGAASIEVQTEQARSMVAADRLGRFRAEGVPAGRMRLRVTVDERAVETSWIAI
jgi:hypothetical protein